MKLEAGVWRCGGFAELGEWPRKTQKEGGWARVVNYELWITELLGCGGFAEWFFRQDCKIGKIRLRNPNWQTTRRRNS
ncbi:MAG: hypothetical protein ACOX9C_00265 [Kiritimatiellia bacterium]